jgi:hypothetical protein
VKQIPKLEVAFKYFKILQTALQQIFLGAKENLTTIGITYVISNECH